MKTQDENLLEYDDDEAVKFILNLVPKEYRKKIDEDTINYVLDVIYEYYEKKGYMDEDSTGEASIDEEDLLKFVVKAAEKDEIDLVEDEIQLILDGEYDYGKSIGVYSEEEN